MNIAIYTLGCKVNQVESGGMARLFSQMGHTVVPWDGPEADAYLINTCSVTAISDAKSRNKIAGVRRTHPNALLAVCGCLSARSDVSLPGVDLVWGVADRAGLVAELVRRLEAGERKSIASDGTPSASAPNGDAAFETLPVPLLTRTRAFLKVQDGCDRFCAYCIIPHVRGRPRSLPLALAAEQARSLAHFPEIVLTGIEIASYGRDLPGLPGLPDLIRTVRENAPDARLRLGSLEPRAVDEALLDACQKAGVCPHFHLSLQSGCDATLAAMGRRYDTADVRRAADRIRRRFSGAALMFDLIVGFPGESETDFQETLAFVEALRPAGAHVFPYSARPGTKAAGLSGQWTRAVKKERAARAGALIDRMACEYAAGWIGQTLPVLFEDDKNGVLRGHADNYLKVSCPGAGLNGQIRPVRIDAVSDGTVWGTMVP